MKVVLLTGATGVLGSVVAPLFLNDENTELRLLLRADSAQQARQRLETLLTDWGEPYTSPTYRARISALRGDVTRHGLGLDSPLYDAQVSSLTHIVHCAANVNMRMSEDEARKISVDSAREVLDLAGAARASGQFLKLDFVSTLGVAGTRRGAIPEQQDLGPRGFHTTYESSKSEAERLVFKKQAEGLPMTVHRPSMIVGDSGTGRIRQFQIFYYICEFLTGRFTSGILPDTAEVQLDTVPVDYVAEVIRFSSDSAATTGRLLHLCSGPGISMTVKELGQRVRGILDDGSLPRTRQIPLSVFGAIVGVLAPILPGRAGRSLKNLSLLLAHLDADQKFENHHTLALLGDAGLAPPPVESYLDAVVGHYQRQGRRR